jgi:hypothetical protein
MSMKNTKNKLKDLYLLFFKETPTGLFLCYNINNKFMWKKFLLFLLLLFFFFLILHFLGWRGFYYTTVWYDKLLHFLAGASVVLIIWWLLEILEKNKKIKKRNFVYKILFSLLFLFMVAVLWEFFEFFIDKFFNFPQLQLGVKDTLWDLGFDIFGGTLVVIFLLLFHRRQETSIPNQSGKI